MRSPKELGHAISSRRHELGFTQKDLAEKLQVTDKAISRWERGLGYPDFQLVEKLSSALGLPLDLLLTGVNADENISATASEANDIAPITDARRPSLSGDLAARLQAISDEYATARALDQQKRTRNKRIGLVIFTFLFCCALLYFIPWRTGIRQTLQGTFSTGQDLSEQVHVEINGALKQYLFHGDYFQGEITVSADKDGEIIFQRTVVGRRTAIGMEMTGHMMQIEDNYLLDGMVYLPDRNKSVALTVWFSDDFSKTMLYGDAVADSEVVAAADPDVDLMKVRDRFMKYRH